MWPPLLGPPEAIYYPFKTLNHGGSMNVIHIGWFYTILNGAHDWIECTPKIEKKTLKMGENGGLLAHRSKVSNDLMGMKICL